MLACVDADYDFLTQGASETSRQMLQNPYVLHTYAYAIENLQCYAPTLRDVCVAVTLNDHMVFNIEEYLREYSQAIFPLFVWSIWHYRRDCYKEFTISDFCTVIETGNFTIQKAPEILQRVRRKVGTRVAQLRIALRLTHGIGNATTTFRVLNPKVTNRLIRIRQREFTALRVGE